MDARDHLSDDLQASATQLTYFSIRVFERAHCAARGEALRFERLATADVPGRLPAREFNAMPQQRCLLRKRHSQVAPVSQLGAARTAAPIDGIFLNRPQL